MYHHKITEPAVRCTVQCIDFPAIAAVYKLLTAVLCVVMAQLASLLAGYEREREYVQLTAVAADQLDSDVHLNYI